MQQDEIETLYDDDPMDVNVNTNNSSGKNNLLHLRTSTSITNTTTSNNPPMRVAAASTSSSSFTPIHHRCMTSSTTNNNSTTVAATNTSTIPFTRLNLVRIPVALPLRWNDSFHEEEKQDPTLLSYVKQQQQKPIQLLNKVVTVPCITISILISIMAWSFTILIFVLYFFTVWNAILYPFGLGVFQNVNVTLTVP